MSVVGWTILGWVIAAGLLVTNVILTVALLREKRKNGLGAQASKLGRRHADDVREHGERVVKETHEAMDRDAASGDAAVEEEANHGGDLVDLLRTRGAGSSGGPPEDDG